MFGLGPWELGIILAIVVVLFGARRLPEIGSGMGEAIRNFKAGMGGQDDKSEKKKPEIDVTPGSEREKVAERTSESAETPR